MIQIYTVYWRHTLDSDPNCLKVKKDRQRYNMQTETKREIEWLY